jgi:hypothetical protein
MTVIKTEHRNSKGHVRIIDSPERAHLERRKQSFSIPNVGRHIEAGQSIRNARDYGKALRVMMPMYDSQQLQCKAPHLHREAPTIRQ